eukprot:TRINITY_DN3906_c0_g1_i2.p1 TRINITY_DN3906_c0_g1~~TRINITY_DN3906_c0_g1_i2.p1  ORF type:complete len:499 (+),score=57.83 TRINITY_DN3906_c0_g1_i2:53-1498(+)
MHAIKAGEIKKFGTKTLAILERHYKGISSRNVLPAVSPGDVAKRFPLRPPERPVGFDTILKDIEEKIIPGVTGWQAPRFFALYPANTSVPAICGDALITGLGAVGLQWEACPSATELEVVVMEWLSHAMGIKEPFTHASLKGGSLIQSTASDIVASVAVCARVKKHAALGVVGETRFHADSSKFVVYMSSDTHFSGAKAARVAGMQVRFIQSKILKNGNYGITASMVETAMKKDISEGKIPCMVELNYGTTNTCGYDSFKGFDKIREKYNVWVHADCAYAGASLVLPDRHKDSRLIQQACTSFNINGSKWLLCGFDSSFLWIRDRSLLLDVYSSSGDFLATAHPTMYAPEYKDWAVPLGRKFRSLRIWMVLNYFGVRGLRGSLTSSIKQADFLRGKIAAHPCTREIVKTDLGLICFVAFSHTTKQNVSEALAACLTSEGFLVYPSKIKDTPFVRIATGGINTTQRDATALRNCISRILKTL